MTEEPHKAEDLPPKIVQRRVDGLLARREKTAPAPVVANDGEELPVLGALQTFIDTERRRMRRTVRALLLFFLVLLAAAAGAGVYVGRLYYNKVNDDVTDLRHNIAEGNQSVLNEVALARNAVAEIKNEVNDTAERIDGQAETIKADLRGDIHASEEKLESTREAMTIINKRVKDTLGQLESLKTAIADFEIDSAMSSSDVQQSLSQLTNRLDAISWENSLLRAELAAMGLELDEVAASPAPPAPLENIPVDLDLSNSLQKINLRMPVPFW